MLEECRVEPICYQELPHSCELAAHFAPQSDHIVWIRSDPFLIVSENGDVERVLIEEFEQMFGMRGNPTPRIVGRDPTEAELSSHHRPLVEVSYKVLHPLGDIVPSQLQRVSLALRGSRSRHRFPRTPCAIYF